MFPREATEAGEGPWLRGPPIGSSPHATTRVALAFLPLLVSGSPHVKWATVVLRMKRVNIQEASVDVARV